MYKLYYSPGACSMAVHVALNEIDAPFELENVSLKEGKNLSPEYMKINPRGSVPTLVDDGLVIREGGAILIYLLDKHKSPLLPSEGALRANALEWLLYCNATLHPTYSRAFFLIKNAAGMADQDKLMDITIEQVQKMWNELDGYLAKSKYLAGDRITIADILATVIANWGGYLKKPISFGPNVKRLLKEISGLPSYQKALATEQVEYKAAA